jgi:4-diphosphocytidyl-2-C-methyl-D-erythritol kinase
MRRIVREAPAKLNLLLAVSPQVVEGKHLLTTVFSTIDLADTLTFLFDDSKERRITVEVLSAPGIAPLALPAERNIVFKAVLALEKTCSRRLDGHLHIAVDKRIPSEGGLAGGSTDAAVTLCALAEIWGIDPLSEPVLLAARKLGADVTFFLHGGCALMGGSGEKLLRSLPQPALDLVLVKPEAGVSTPAAFAAFDAQGLSRSSPSTICRANCCAPGPDPQAVPSAEGLVQLLESPNVSPEKLAGEMTNNLCPAACTLMPELEALIAEVASQRGVYRALLTGSGSTVFGVCESPQVAARVAKRFWDQGYWSRACVTGGSACE